MGNRRLDSRVVQLIEQPLRHRDLAGGGVHRHALLIVIGGDLLDVRDGADDGRDLLELLNGRGVGEVEDALAILSRYVPDQAGKKGKSKATVRMGVPFTIKVAHNAAGPELRLESLSGPRAVRSER